MIDRKRLREMGVPEDMSADDVKALFSLPDDDDRMHQQGTTACKRCGGWKWMKMEDPCFRCQGSGVDPETPHPVPAGQSS